MERLRIAKEIEELIDKVVSDLTNDDVDWILRRIKDTIDELLED